MRRWVAASPYLSQHRLGETGLHEDLYDLGAIHEAVTVRVCLLEEFIVPFPVGSRNHPIHCRLQHNDNTMTNASIIAALQVLFQIKRLLRRLFFTETWSCCCSLALQGTTSQCTDMSWDVKRGICKKFAFRFWCTVQCLSRMSHFNMIKMATEEEMSLNNFEQHIKKWCDLRGSFQVKRMRELVVFRKTCFSDFQLRFQKSETLCESVCNPHNNVAEQVQPLTKEMIKYILFRFPSRQPLPCPTKGQRK